MNGEGRGHLAQALALKELLDEAGHELVGVLVGEGTPGARPDLFAGALGVELGGFPSLRMMPDAAHRTISAFGTLAKNVLRIPRYLGSLRALRGAVRRLRPDVVVNFWDHLGGLALGTAAPSGARLISLSSNHYLFDHPQVAPPRGSAAELALFRMLNRFTAPPGTPRAALTLRLLDEPPGWTTRLLPPMLRQVVLDAEPTPGDHLLVYLLHHGHAEDLVRWHEAHPDTVLHVFWDRPTAPARVELRPNLVCHLPSERLFLELMRGCRAVVTSAGFQAVAEALWLGKPVMVVPTEGHIEQRWNAQEAVAAGAGIESDRFDLTPLLEYLPHHRHDTAAYRAWVLGGRRRILDWLEDAAA